MDHPLLNKQPFHRRVLDAAFGVLTGSHINPNSIYPTIYSNFQSGNLSHLIRNLNSADSSDVSGVFRLCNGSTNPKAIKFFKVLMNHENTELRLAARRFYFKYLKNNELQGLNRANINKNRLSKVYDLLEQYFISSSSQERDELSIKIAKESGIAYDTKYSDLVTAVDNSGAGHNAIGSQLNGFIALLQGSSAGGILFDIIHDEEEGFLQRNKNLVPQFVLSGKNDSPALSAHCGYRYIQSQGITQNMPRAFRGVFYLVKPGQHLAPQLVSCSGFNSQAVIDEEIKFLKEAGQLSDSEARNFSFRFQSLALDLFSVNDPRNRSIAIKNFALAYALLNFRKQKIEASHVSNASNFSPLGYNLIASDKETALKYAQRQIDLMGQVLSEKFLDDSGMELTFRQVLKDNHDTYLQTMAVSQLCSETSQFDARVRAVSDHFSSHNMGLGAPKMAPIPISNLVSPQTLRKTMSNRARDTLAKEIQNKIKQIYGEPLVDLEVINRIFDSNNGKFIIKNDSKIDLSRGPNSYNEWRDYISSLSSYANSVLDDFKSRAQSNIGASFIDEAMLTRELDLLEKNLVQFLSDPQKSNDAGSYGAQRALVSQGSPITYNIAVQVRRFIEKSDYLRMNWSEIFSESSDELNFSIGPETNPTVLAKECINQLKSKRRGPGERGNNFQKSLETLLIQQNNPFLNIIQNHPNNLSTEERIIQNLILKNRDREVNSPYMALEKLLFGSGNADDPRASDKMLMGLMQLIALGDQDTQSSQAVRRYIGNLLTLDLSRVNITRILGDNTTNSFETALGHITRSGINSSDVANFHRFAYYDSLSLELSQNLSSLRVDIENKRRSSLSILIGPLLKILGREGEHIQVLDQLDYSLSSLAIQSGQISDLNEEDKPETLRFIQEQLSTQFRPILIKSSEAQKDWLRNLSSDCDRLDILSLIIKVCSQLFKLAPAPQQSTQYPYSHN